MRDYVLFFSDVKLAKCANVCTVLGVWELRWIGVEFNALKVSFKRYLSLVIWALSQDLNV